MAYCEICGIDNAQQHHIIPRYLGGEDKRGNFAYLCWKHHIELHRAAEKMIRDYGDVLGENLDVERKRSCYVTAYIRIKEGWL